MQCQLFRTETSKAVSELNYDYICIKAGTGRPLGTPTIGLVLLVRRAIIYETELQSQPITQLLITSLTGSGKLKGLHWNNTDEIFYTLIYLSGIPLPLKAREKSQLPCRRGKGQVIWGKRSYTWSKVYSRLGNPSCAGATGPRAVPETKRQARQQTPELCLLDEEGRALKPRKHINVHSSPL
ncbi:uncharacterized protein LOC116462232 isoform X2 [Hylobates moloch]|uniref:uncharacterized protein LOC116462232 isoform X2 n=1 Tax=Hylobates moloch TaxID=81572 RepID=UPI00136285B9|nr:uncharacterized protein LOC116462232 isoform X2 [Hylobates moloch]